jgi:hypothetical protein
MCKRLGERACGREWLFSHERIAAEYALIYQPALYTQRVQAVLIQSRRRSAYWNSQSMPIAGNRGSQ